MCSLACFTISAVALFTAGATHADFQPHIWSHSFGDTCGQYVQAVDTDASGAYFVRLESTGGVLTQKIVLLE